MKALYACASEKRKMKPLCSFPSNFPTHRSSWRRHLSMDNYHFTSTAGCPTAVVTLKWFSTSSGYCTLRRLGCATTKRCAGRSFGEAAHLFNGCLLEDRIQVFDTGAVRERAEQVHACVNRLDAFLSFPMHDHKLDSYAVYTKRTASARPKDCKVASVEI